MNLRALSTHELAKLRRNVLAELKARRPKANKGKGRKVKSAEERERERLYAEFREINSICWNCHRTKPPRGWSGPWIPNERAHITKDGLGKRLEDVRLVCSLCTWCHRLNTEGLITVAEMIRLKREHDPDNYDPEFLQKHSVRRLSFPQ